VEHTGKRCCVAQFEAWSIDAFCQTELLKDGKLLCITLYADKTCLSSFGTAQGYLIMAQINNLPHNIWNGTGLGLTQVIGWLPIVSVAYDFYGLNGYLAL
jgi:hypothetical protein